MSARPLLAGAALAAAFALPLSGATITIVNMDNPGVGFNDATPRSPVGGNPGTTLGEQRLNVVKYAAAFWGEKVQSPVEIRVEAQWKAMNCSASGATLASAGPMYVYSDFEGAPRANTWYPIGLASKLAGEDLEPGENDIEANFNIAIEDGSCAFSRKFYYGLDAQPTAGTSDFATVVIHELGHGLGFTTFVSRSTGARFAGSDGVARDDHYMVHLYDATTGKTWDQMTDGERLTSTTNTANLLWNGPAVVAASGVLQAGVGTGGRPQMYAPNPSESGSSVSHWSKELYPNEIMEPSYTIAQHQLLVTDELMSDIGWGLASGGSGYSWLLPSSARSSGVPPTYWKTNLSIGNRGAAEARFRIKFLGHDVDGTNGPESQELVLGSNQSVTYENVLETVLSQPDKSYGALRVTANVPTLNVLGQTWTPDATRPFGSFGQSVPAFAASDLITPGTIRSIVGVNQVAGKWRSNLVLANGGTTPVTVDVLLFSTTGASLGTPRSWTLPPLGMTQVGNIVTEMGYAGNVTDAQLILTTSTSGGAFAAYVALIDNVTGDPRTLLPK